MNCPYCGKEMEAGTLRSRGGSYFLPEGENVALFTRAQLRKARAVVLPPDQWEASLHPESPKAYCCRDCRKLLLEYEGEYGIYS